MGVAIQTLHGGLIDLAWSLGPGRTGGVSGTLRRYLSSRETAQRRQVPAQAQTEAGSRLAQLPREASSAPSSTSDLPLRLGESGGPTCRARSQSRRLSRGHPCPAQRRFPTCSIGTCTAACASAQRAVHSMGRGSFTEKSAVAHYTVYCVHAEYLS